MGYSRAAVDNNYVFTSGCTGSDYQVMSISNDILEQAESCFQNIELALEQAGKGTDQVLRVCYIFPNRADFKPCWPILEKYFGNVRPAEIIIVAGFLDQQMKLEIEVTERVKWKFIDNRNNFCCCFVSALLVSTTVWRTEYFDWSPEFHPILRTLMQG